jgi:hypothetical protein
MADTSQRISISYPIIIVIVGSLLCAAFANNSIYLICCLVTCFLIVYLLWRNSRPGILVFAMLMQLSQVIAYVFWMNTLGFTIESVAKHGGIAVVVSCLGLLFMALTISLGLKSLAMPSIEQLNQQARLFNEKKILTLYIFSTLFMGSIGVALGGNPGFAQILMAMSSFKWIFFMVYGYVAWINKKNRLILGAIIIFEFTTSLYSYFSSFKEVIFYTIILSLTFIRTISIKQLITGIVIGGLLFFLLLTWTAIKGDYRKFLNGGTKQQVIEVSRSEAFSKIGQKVSSLKWEDYQNVLSLFLYRAQYILHLAKTMDRVPDLLPHEYGQVWLDNITFVLEPRLFFPDKPIYEATVKTKKYTGIRYAGFKDGASFSLGYFADSYIDFGYVGMLLPLIMVALFVVIIFRVLYGFRKLNILLRYAVINVALIQFTSFEADGLFLFGQLLLMFLVFWFLSRFVLPRLQVWLYKTNT